MAQYPKETSKESYQHMRIITSLLGKSEKKILIWMAARMPAWVVPDTLTMVGLFASVLIFLGYALTTIDKGFIWLASFGFVLNWFGDSLDGTLARYRKIERPRYGFFVDHIIDTVAEGLVFLGLGLSPYLRIEIALLALVTYLWVSIYAYLTTYVNGIFRISYGPIGPTEVRIIAILANTVVFFTGNHTYTFWLTGSPITTTFYDLVVIAITIFGISMFIFSSISTALVLSREDRIAARDKRRARKVARREAKLHARQVRAEERAYREAQRVPRIKPRPAHVGSGASGDKITIERVRPQNEYSGRQEMRKQKSN